MTAPTAPTSTAGGVLGTYPDLPGKVALVTGGSGGIGGATCLALAANGVRIAVNGRRSEAVEAVVDAVRAAGGTALAVAADCTDAEAIGGACERVTAELGPVDIVCAFAGGGRPPQPLVLLAEDEWRTDVEGNLTATFLTLKACLPVMIDRERGSVITMASGAARHPGGAPIAYAAAKAGIVNLTQQAAHELGPKHVRVNCISPAAVMTDAMARSVPADRQRQLLAAYPLSRLGRPDDVAAAALFLASDASSWITGVTLDVAGGQIMQ